MSQAHNIPHELDWVERRAACSAVEVFRQLQTGIENDIAFINKRPGGDAFRATLTSDGRTFVIASMSNLGPRVVLFYAHEKIEIRDELTKRNTVARLTLNDAGRCVLKVDGRELEQWQFRKLALENLFFGVDDDE